MSLRGLLDQMHSDAALVAAEPFDSVREAYVLDLIDIETFERLREDQVAGRTPALPGVVMRLALDRSKTPTLRNVHSVLKDAYGGA